MTYILLLFLLFPLVPALPVLPAVVGEEKDLRVLWTKWRFYDTIFSTSPSPEPLYEAVVRAVLNDKHVSSPEPEYDYEKTDEKLKEELDDGEYILETYRNIYETFTHPSPLPELGKPPYDDYYDKEGVGHILEWF